MDYEEENIDKIFAQLMPTEASNIPPRRTSHGLVPVITPSIPSLQSEPARPFEPIPPKQAKFETSYQEDVVISPGWGLNIPIRSELEWSCMRPVNVHGMQRARYSFNEPKPPPKRAAIDVTFHNLTFHIINVIC